MKINLNLKAYLKKLYTYIPFKKYILTLVKNTFTVPPTIYKHLNFKGIITVKNYSGTSFKIFHHGYNVENDIFWSGLYGEWEKDSLFLWSKLSEESEVILDIGANTGVYSLLSKSLNKTSNVYSFEPIPKIYKELKLNSKLNGFDIKLENMALSNFTGKSVIYNTTGSHSYDASLDKCFRGNNSEITEIPVKCMRLDDYIRLNKIDKVDLMKIDVETLEAEVLEGMGKFLHDYQPNILVEVLNDKVAKNIENIISGIDYRYFNLDENGHFELCNNLSSSKYHNVLICHPKLANKIIPHTRVSLR